MFIHILDLTTTATIQESDRFQFVFVVVYHGNGFGQTMDGFDMLHSDGGRVQSNGAAANGCALWAFQRLVSASILWVLVVQAVIAIVEAGDGGGSGSKGASGDCRLGNTVAHDRRGT